MPVDKQNKRVYLILQMREFLLFCDRDYQQSCSAGQFGHAGDTTATALMEDVIMAAILPAALVLAVIGCGLIAGVYFAFSTFIMTAFAHIPPVQGIAAMNSINVTIVRSPFMILFLATPVLCVVIAVLAFTSWREGASVRMLAGAAVYLIASFLSTIVVNVPMNDGLAAVNANGADALSLWASYLKDWTWWNHIRTIASLLASIAFVRALMIVPA
jgi:uncharacterized membrane protein